MDHVIVIPAQAGMRLNALRDPRLRRDDELMVEMSAKHSGMGHSFRALVKTR